MAGPRRRSNFVRSQRRESLWFFFDGTFVNLTAVGGTITHSLNAAALALRPFTIIRSRFELSFDTDQTAAAENQIGAWAMAVVSDQASAVGVAAVPTPVTDAGSDLFFAYQPMVNAVQFATQVGFQNTSRRYTVDSKAMRKVEDGQDVIIVAEFDASGAGFNLGIAGRVLIKTH